MATMKSWPTSRPTLKASSGFTIDSSPPSRLRRKVENPSPWISPNAAASTYCGSCEPVGPLSSVSPFENTIAAMLVRTIVTGISTSTSCEFTRTRSSVASASVTE